MSDFNRKLLEEINLLRTEPRNYSNKVLKYIDYFKGNVLYLPGGKQGLQTEEGAAAYKEAANFLSNEEKKEPLTPSKGLCQVSEILVSEAQKDAANCGNINTGDLAKKIGKFKGGLNRLFEFGAETPELVVINLIVSDGDPSRTQRTILLNPNARIIGLANGKHNLYNHCTALVITNMFKNNTNSDDNGFLEP